MFIPILIIIIIIPLQNVGLAPEPEPEPEPEPDWGHVNPGGRPQQQNNISASFRLDKWKKLYFFKGYI